jgi:uncharacterized ferredoxin-like protein
MSDKMTQIGHKEQTVANYVNVGVQYIGNGSDIPTKTALKRAIADEPSNVRIYSTSGFSEQYDDIATNVVVGVKYSVTGPNPYTNRKWYATVEKAPNGKITVK